MSTKSRQRKAALRRNAREMREDPLRLISRRNDWLRRTYTIQVGETLAGDEVTEYIRKMQSSIKRDGERVAVDYIIPKKEEKRRKKHRA